MQEFRVRASMEKVELAQKVITNRFEIDGLFSTQDHIDTAWAILMDYLDSGGVG